MDANTWAQRAVARLLVQCLRGLIAELMFEMEAAQRRAG